MQNVIEISLVSYTLLVRRFGIPRTSLLINEIGTYCSTSYTIEKLKLSAGLSDVADLDFIFSS